MNQTQAIAKLRKVIGPNLAYRCDKSAPDAESRAAIRAEWSAARQVANEAAAACMARREELLNQDPEYQRLKAAAAAATNAVESKRSGLYRYRVTVGRVQGVGFSVVAAGDNWDDVIAQATEAAS